MLETYLLTFSGQSVNPKAVLLYVDRMQLMSSSITKRTKITLKIFIANLPIGCLFNPRLGQSGVDQEN